jgi:hypothetical protein
MKEERYPSGAVGKKKGNYRFESHELSQELKVIVPERKLNAQGSNHVMLKMKQFVQLFRGFL